MQSFYELDQIGSDWLAQIETISTSTPCAIIGEESPQYLSLCYSMQEGIFNNSINGVSTEIANYFDVIISTSFAPSS